jgi:hypothetical protein
MITNSKNNIYKQEYKKILNEINKIGCNFSDDNEKIKIIGMIHNLKNVAYNIEPVN